MTREQAAELTRLHDAVLQAMHDGDPRRIRDANAAFDDYVDSINRVVTPTDEQIIKAIGGPYHCVDCMDDLQWTSYPESIERLRALFA